MSGLRLGDLKEALRHEEIINCMRCGFCLQACPTYKLTLHEPRSPRGRIALARAVAEGQLTLDDITGPLDQCIGCRACETACPAGVHYGTILEAARATIVQNKQQGFGERLVRKVGLKWILGTPGGIRFGAFGLWFWQATGLSWLARQIGLVKAVAGAHIADMEAAMPKAASPLKRFMGGGPGHIFHAVGERRARVGFFTGCVQEIAFWQENQDAIALLQKAGCDVLIVPGQGCCGAVHAHTGEESTAHDQARRNIAAFEKYEIDYVVNAAGGCGAALKEYKLWLAGDPGWAKRAAKFSACVRDVSEILLALPPIPMGPRPGRVTLQDSCHMRNVQKLVSEPRKLLARVPGLEFVELGNADTCCGAGGVYNVTQPATANAIGAEKAGRVKTTGAKELVVTNPPCQLHMRASLRRSGLDQEGVRVVHIVTILREAMEAAQEK
ncbi:MAG TPA: (Fe-S)-binding protein [Symbiobacteriaceae bacterium]|nr:(Fe-S)-binding protein [Symbiobacteriaceae bacterium]